MAIKQEKETNPSNLPEGLPKNYRPLSVAQLQLEVPEKPGYHRHWFRGTRKRLSEALRAGYNFVDPDDPYVDVNNFDIAGDSTSAGSTDLGTRISIASGDGAGENEQAGRMYLMECTEEVWKHSQSLVQAGLDNVAESLRGGQVGAQQNGESRYDAGLRYVPKGQAAAPLFYKKS